MRLHTRSLGNGLCVLLLLKLVHLVHVLSIAGLVVDDIG